MPLQNGHAVLREPRVQALLSVISEPLPGGDYEIAALVWSYQVPLYSGCWMSYKAI